MLPSPLVAPAVSAFSDFTRLRIGFDECSKGPTGAAVCSFPEHAYANTTHSFMARAIQPIHGKSDGDALFAASTSEVFAFLFGVSDLGVLSSELACAAVLKCVPTPYTEPENVEEGKS